MEQHNQTTGTTEKGRATWGEEKQNEGGKQNAGRRKRNAGEKENKMPGGGEETPKIS